MDRPRCGLRDSTRGATYVDPKMRAGIETAITRLEEWLAKYGTSEAAGDYCCGPGMLGPDGELTKATKKTIRRLQSMLDGRRGLVEAE